MGFKLLQFRIELCRPGLLFNESGIKGVTDRNYESVVVPENVSPSDISMFSLQPLKLMVRLLSCAVKLLTIRVCTSMEDKSSLLIKSSPKALMMVIPQIALRPMGLTLFIPALVIGGRFTKGKTYSFLSRSQLQPSDNSREV